MPGHIIRAQCSCGYEKELMPGASGFSDKGYSMAYTASGKGIGTFDQNFIEAEALEIIDDPFLENDWFKDEETGKPQESTAAPTIILCPHCKSTSLVLTWVGMWD
jgi:hypothetical protein